MLIHKGDKYEITQEGEVATKSDGATHRTMKFYPERDIYNISGEIDELTAWQILHDIANQAQTVKTPISPDHILIDRTGFHLSEWSESKDFRFVAPEGYSAIWALGASVFYAFLGCHVFQGLGGKGQSPTAPIPTLRKDLPELSSIIDRCLDFQLQKRPALKEIVELSKVNISRCKSLQPEFPPLKTSENNKISLDEIDRHWPDEMY